MNSGTPDGPPVLSLLRFCTGKSNVSGMDNVLIVLKTDKTNHNKNMLYLTWNLTQKTRYKGQ